MNVAIEFSFGVGGGSDETRLGFRKGRLLSLLDAVNAMAGRDLSLCRSRDVEQIGVASPVPQARYVA
jgi:hypothetical protein